jgi:NTP pyrophosphatase (non-canonical NTP hydrolase)
MKVSEIMESMDRFVASKGWYEADSIKPQTAENMAKSISIETAELLECFQWTNTPAEDLVRDELADIVLYAAQLANVSGIDLTKAIEDKLARNQTREWKKAG